MAWLLKLQSWHLLDQAKLTNPSTILPPGKHRKPATMEVVTRKTSGLQLLYCRKTLGTSTLPVQGMGAGWSPSTHAFQRGKQIDAARAKQKASRSTRKAKIKRRALRDTRGRLQDVSQLREGVTYVTACTLVGGDIDTEEILAPVTKPTLHTLTCNQARTVIVFDLETTSLQRTAQLTQMTARVYGLWLYIQYS